MHLAILLIISQKTANRSQLHFPGICHWNGHFWHHLCNMGLCEGSVSVMTMFEASEAQKCYCLEVTLNYLIKINIPLESSIVRGNTNSISYIMR